MADAALCARSAISDTRTAAFRPLQLEPPTHHGAPIAPRMGTLALTERAAPAAVPEAVAGDEEEVLFEESPICEQPVCSAVTALCEHVYVMVKTRRLLPTNERWPRGAPACIYTNCGSNPPGHDL